jgi:hypothetical protein
METVPVVLVVEAPAGSCEGMPALIAHLLRSTLERNGMRFAVRIESAELLVRQEGPPAEPIWTVADESLESPVGGSDDEQHEPKHGT